MATKSQTVAGLTAGRSTNESLEARRRREAAAKAQATAGFTAGRTTPPKATTGGQIASDPTGQTWLNATGQTRRGDALGNPTSSVVNAASVPQPESPYAKMTDAYTHLTPAVQASMYSSNPTGSGWNSGTTDSIDGYLKQFGYTPQGLTSIYENPSILANDVLGTRGITNAGMGNELAELFDMLYASQFVNNRGGSATDNDTLNYIANAMQQAVTPGGQYLDPYKYMQTILGQSGGDANPLSSFLTGENLTPDQQMSRVNQLIANGMPGMNSYAQQAYGGFLQNQQDQYRTGLAKGDPNSSSYFDFLQNSQLGNWIR
jgi:hypothetical protein